jgi:hypothetical protein
VRVAIDIPPSPATLTAALEGLTSLNYVLMGRGGYPPLYEAGIRYEPERPRLGEPEDWQNCHQLLLTKRGDCEDLGCYLAAQYRRHGVLGARAIAVQSGRRKYHTLVELPDGRREDPSRRLGLK